MLVGEWWEEGRDGEEMERTDVSEEAGFVCPENWDCGNIAEECGEYEKSGC